MWRFSLVLAVFSLIAATSQAQSLSKGLVGYWSFDDSTYRDSSIFHNDGSFKTTRPKFIKGPASKFALQFLGGESIIVANDSALNFGTGSAFTVSFWMKLDTSDVNYTLSRVLISKHLTASTNTDYIFFVENKKLVFGTGESLDSVVWMTAPRPQLGIWHHIVATQKYDPSTKLYTKKLYVNNTLVKQGTTAIKGTVNSSSLTFGNGLKNSTNCYYKGGLDEVRIYDREITASEVTMLNKYTPVSEETIAAAEGIRVENPFRKKLRIFGLGESYKVHVTLRDLQGRIQFSGQINAENGAPIDITLPQNLPAAVYICTLQTPSGVKSYKVIRERE